MSAESGDEGILRAYLLGRAAPDAREGVEQRLFSDDEIFWQRLSLVEDELVDEYARGGLDAGDRARFEAHFLVSDERRAKLALALALGEHADRLEHGRRPGRGGLRPPLTVPSWALAVAATVLLAAPLAWRLAGERAPRPDPSAWLSTGLVRDVAGELTRVTLPEGCRLVRLNVEPGPEDHASYRASLHEVTGEEVWARDGLHAAPVDGRTAVTLAVPCSVLPPQDYYVRLEGVSADAAPQRLGRYDFRVLRR